MAETIEILNKLSEKSNSLLKNNKTQYVGGFLDTASNISDEIEKHHIKKHQNQLFISTWTLFFEAQMITSNRELLKEIRNILDKKEKPEELLQSIDFYNRAINIINQLITNSQAFLEKKPSAIIDQTALPKIENALKSPTKGYRGFCKSVNIKSIQRLINSPTQQNCNNLMFAVFGDKQFIENYFTQLYGKPVHLNRINHEEETAILWRLTLSKNTIIYILGLTTDKLLKHSEQKWFKILGNFNSVLISIESLEQSSNQNSALMVMLSLIHCDAIHLTRSTSDEYVNHQHFLFKYIKHIHFGTLDNFQKASNWIVQSIFPYNGIKQ